MSGPESGPQGRLAAARTALAELTDPEIPVLTLADLGVLRDVRVEGDGVEVDITPTYSGCPAMDAIRDDVTATLHAQGFADVRVRLVLAPAWTTEDMSEAGRVKLAAYGIAPPTGRAAAGPVQVALGATRSALGATRSGSRRPAPVVACPRCGSTATVETARFASTACKSLWRCTSCAEPFDHFKDI